MTDVIITKLLVTEIEMKYQDELYKDMPVKTENNKPYIDNIDAYNRDSSNNQIT